MALTVTQAPKAAANPPPSADAPASSASAPSTPAAPSLPATTPAQSNSKSFNADFATQDKAVQNDLAKLTQLAQMIGTANDGSPGLDTMLQQYTAIQSDLSTKLSAQRADAASDGQRDDVAQLAGNVYAGQHLDAQVGNLLRELNGTPNAFGSQLGDPGEGGSLNSTETAAYSSIFATDQTVSRQQATVTQSGVDTSPTVLNALGTVDGNQSLLYAAQNSNAVGEQTLTQQDESDLSGALNTANSALNGQNVGDDSALQKKIQGWQRTPFIGAGSQAGPGGTADYTTATDGKSPIAYAAPPANAADPTVPINDVKSQMTTDQAKFLGWAGSQVLQGKQVSVPPADAPAWNRLIADQLQNNRSGVNGTNLFDDQSYSDYSWSPDNNVTTGGDVSGARSKFERSGGFDAVAADTAWDDQPSINVGKAALSTLEQFGIELAGVAVGEAGGAAVAAVATTGLRIGTRILSGAAGDAARGGDTAGASAGTGAANAGGTLSAADAATDAANPIGNARYINTPTTEPTLPATAPPGTTYVSSANRPLFGPSGLPDATDAFQGNVGNCWFASALQQVADRFPQTIKNNIQENPDGTVRVAFNNDSGPPTWVQVDDTIPMNAQGQPLIGDASGPKWAALYEKAAAKYYGYIGKADNSNTGGTGYDLLDGGTVDQAVSALVGRSNAGQAYPSAVVQAAPDKVFTALEQSLTMPSGGVATAQASPHGIAFTNFSKGVDPKYGVMDSHAYSIVHVDGSGPNKTVTLENPWGYNNMKPTAPGVTVNGSYITMPYDDLVSIANSVYI